ncbi:hypothetical protein BU24DRAFT_135955 [Aaosphaeria arxii CBS 175.79]|uniref:RHD domain-containing protein n=1 Tax=Aaosphaeria arxii CBS 175.79 TaxID=1450172 RepID=A0A6A5Y3V8_9PLEO|nr:uncharacterized protein BU24DRAFT_135955 [Aaosphaeria arxii CBS 175.79]KAF2020255.1 hypothetical protein BU24DRAFT_135955 [Aaosphaeria arxii CBS 175.79]
MNATESRSAWPLIWINGFPGTSKYRIAKLTATLLSDGDPLLIHNHSLIDPVDARYSRDHPDYQQERRRGREAVFKSRVEDPAFRARIIIFTDFQSNNDLGRDVAREYEAAALRAKRSFLPVYLECDVKENIRRVTSLERGSSATTKLLNPEILVDMRSRCQLFHFDSVEGITFDVTDMGPEEAAEALAREVKRVISDMGKHQR